MLTIDGSFGEGGGQILRTSVAMAAITETPVRIRNIRSNRPNPGLSAQHLTAIEAVASLTGAEVSGLLIRSTEVTFAPGEIRGGAYRLDIGTAGSISLLLQCLIPVALHYPETSVFDITGGTDVKWSPPIDYLRHVTLPALALAGCGVEIEVLQRGYYPRGGGQIRAEITPSRIMGVDFDRTGANTVYGCSHASGLPEHVAKRQRDAAATRLEVRGYAADIITEHNPAAPEGGKGGRGSKGGKGNRSGRRGSGSTGSGITLWRGLMGGSALGERGKPAEMVGSGAADRIIRELDSGASVDVYLADQLIPYMAIAGFGSFTVRELSSHTKTNIWACEQFTDAKFEIESIDQNIRVACR
ncbi:MAG: RNA 3'-phosphate cyclase [Candidatus Methanogaster sp.]|uniref:RNA 3'-phosphate cyclase n=1 Tax=Candidatus Methanogaster sp. TaxID=3386292 RepID=A0AC61L5E8_9EURY|nr:MAG: RNA 3'-phosphate cyclase [ANME-2 cluster archaeon]